MYAFDEEEQDPSKLESLERQEARAARAGLIGGIGLLLLGPPLAYMQAILTFNIFEEISLEPLGLPACLLPMGLALVFIVWIARRNRRLGKTPLTAVLIIYLLTILLASAAAILAFRNAALAT